jgi:hypothetical protein
MPLPVILGDKNLVESSGEFSHRHSKYPRRLVPNYATESNKFLRYIYRGLTQLSRRFLQAFKSRQPKSLIIDHSRVALLSRCVRQNDQFPKLETTPESPNILESEESV